MPSLPRFDNCCFCVDLKTGCFIIGYLQLIGEIIATVTLLMTTFVGGAVATSDDKEKQETGILIMGISIITLLVVSFFLAFTIILLIGLHKDKRGHIKAYLWYGSVFLVITFITFIANLFQHHPQGTANIIIQNVFSITISAYFLLVIRSYYLKMEENKGPAVYNTA